MRKRKPFNELKPATRARYEREVRALIELEESAEKHLIPVPPKETRRETNVRCRQDVLRRIDLVWRAGLPRM